MKSKIVKSTLVWLTLEYSLAIVFWVVVFYFLSPYWNIIFNIGIVAYSLLYFCVAVLFFIVLPICYLVKLIKERTALQKKVEELEDKLEKDEL